MSVYLQYNKKTAPWDGLVDTLSTGCVWHVLVVVPEALVFSFVVSLNDAASLELA